MHEGEDSTSYDAPTIFQIFALFLSMVIVLLCLCPSRQFYELQLFDTEVYERT